MDNKFRETDNDDFILHNILYSTQHLDSLLVRWSSRAHKQNKNKQNTQETVPTMSLFSLSLSFFFFFVSRVGLCARLKFTGSNSRKLNHPVHSQMGIMTQPSNVGSAVCFGSSCYGQAASFNHLTYKVLLHLPVISIPSLLVNVRFRGQTLQFMTVYASTDSDKSFKQIVIGIGNKNIR